MSLAGSFLVARPVLRDPNFERTVVLLLAHGAEGAFGLVVNRPAVAKDLPWPVFAGGPCPSPGLLMLHGHPEWAGRGEDSEAEDEEGEGTTQELAPGIFTGDASCLERAGQPSAGEALR